MFNLPHSRVRILALCIFLTLPACSNSSDSSNKTTPIQPSQAAIPADTLRLPLSGSVTTLDPGKIDDVTTMEVASELFLGLTSFDPNDYQPRPSLADSWQHKNHGTTYTFHLRPNAKWSDGTTVTAHDVVWAVQRNLAPASGAPYVFALFVLKNAEQYHQKKIKDFSQVGIKALDQQTVEFTLDHPASYFPAMVSLWPFRPLPMKIIQQYPNQWASPDHIATNGPYLLKKWERGKRLILQRNPQFYDADHVQIHNLNFYIVRESSVGLRMYEHGELDLIGGNFLALPQQAMTRIGRDPTLSQQFHHQPDFCTNFYGFNTKKPPTDNPLVRKAIAAAINKKLLIQLVTKGGEEPAYTFTRPPIFGSVDPKEGIGIHFNPQQARTWLTEAGYPDGKGLPPIILTHNISETHATIAKAIKTMLEFYLHITVVIKQLDWEQYTRAIKTTTATHMFRYGWCADYPDANNWLNDLFHPDTSSNLVHWNNRHFADLVDQAKQEHDPKQRQVLYRQAEIILNQSEVAIVPISFSTASYLVKPRVKGWFHMALGGQAIGHWRLEDKKTSAPTP
ncbi:MAG: peptide ABC transporter substrate-binding protein [Mariprofundales bacterium]